MTVPEWPRTEQWNDYLGRCEASLESLPPLVVEGTLTRMVGLTLEAVGCQAAIGDRCQITTGLGRSIESEVVGFAGDSLYLMPTGELHGLAPNARVRPIGRAGDVKVGESMLGRVLDGSGRPLDDGGPLRTEIRVPLTGIPVNPLSRAPISEPLDVGVQSINALLSVGRGQRLGLFAGSGVGKSSLLGMMTRFTEADVIVVGLIGERGREVKEFIEDILGEEGMSRSVVVATPADNPPLMRLNGAYLATSIAEYFRDTGRNVLLLMDSLTRFAQAQREIALAIGEPPATRGYPPSVFTLMPKLVERAGNGMKNGGSITAFYTILTEDDDHSDPLAEAARAILDGHIVLSRELAAAGHHPAIDIEASISRAMHSVVEPAHLAKAREFREHYARYQANRDLINVGAYTPGSDPLLDHSIALYPALLKFMRQGMGDKATYEQSLAELAHLLPEQAADSPPEPEAAPGTGLDGFRQATES